MLRAIARLIREPGQLRAAGFLNSDDRVIWRLDDDGLFLTVRLFGRRLTISGGKDARV